MKKVLSIALILCIVCMVCFTSCLSPLSNYTEDIDNYDTDEFPIGASFFPDEIPSNAQVVAFSHYYYHQNEVYDIYLELKFDSTGEMNSFISEITASYLEEQESLEPYTNVGWIVEETNPYDSSYTDLICTLYSTATKGEHTTGYRIVMFYEHLMYKCNSGIISYSAEESTVILSRIRGDIRENIHEYIPKYFTRFNVPIQEGYERVIYLEPILW